MVNEEHETEFEVLQSIYDGDENFKKTTNARVQYKFNEGHEKSFVVEIEWPEDYPNIPCTINMDVFYNQHIPNEVRKAIEEKLSIIAKDNEGMASTFTIIEHVKENFDEIVADWSLIKMSDLSVKDDVEKNTTDSNRKEPLTKAAKRRMWDRNEGTGCERGHNWVDILSHLQQTKDR